MSLVVGLRFQGRGMIAIDLREEIRSEIRAEVRDSVRDVVGN